MLLPGLLLNCKDHVCDQSAKHVCPCTKKSSSEPKAIKETDPFVDCDASSYCPLKCPKDTKLTKNFAEKVKGPAIYCETEDKIKHGPYIDWFENGQVSQQGFYLNGKPHNTWKSWSSKGIQKTEGSYNQGIPHGIITGWSKSGTKMAEGHFLDGKRHGKMVNWFEGGVKKKSGNYINGEPHGRETQWYKNGQKKSAASFYKGKACGIWECWTQLGKPESCEDIFLRLSDCCSSTPTGAICLPCKDKSESDKL